MRLIYADALFKNMEKASWFNNADRDEIAERLVLTAPTIGGWVNVKDRPPEEDGDYLVYSTFGLIDRLRFADGAWWDYGAECQPEVVTHWMPLPEPPEGEENG